MNEQVKQASDRMLAKGTITQDEHAQLQKIAVEFPHYNLSYPPTNAGAIFAKAGPYLGALASMLALGTIGKETIVDPIIASMKASQSYEQMKKKVPQLRGKSDEDMVDYFNVIKAFSPKAASNPLVAGALVNKMMEFGGVDHKLVQDIASIQGDAKPSMYGKFIEKGISKSLKVGKDEDSKHD